eukprot:COSAG03_NODE_7149_length_957_cov_0.614219_2_plen_84_part_01
MARRQYLTRGALERPAPATPAKPTEPPTELDEGEGACAPRESEGLCSSTTAVSFGAKSILTKPAPWGPMITLAEREKVRESQRE